MYASSFHCCHYCHSICLHDYIELVMCSTFTVQILNIEKPSPFLREYPSEWIASFENHPPHLQIKHDALDVAGLVKLYLRELPGETLLFTPQTAAEFTVSFLKNIVNEEDKVASVKRSIGRLPRANKDTLQALAEHFRLVTKYEKKNKMSIDNLIKW